MASSKFFFFGAFSIFESGGITKHLMTGHKGNSEFCFPSTSMFPSASPQGTLSVSGKQNSLFPLWPVIKCLVIFKRSYWAVLHKVSLWINANEQLLKWKLIFHYAAQSHLTPKPHWATIEQYFLLVVFIKLHKIISNSMNKTLKLMQLINWKLPSGTFNSHKFLIMLHTVVLGFILWMKCLCSII